MRCIKCGSRKVSLVKYNEGYSFTKGIVGTAVFGSVGAVAGINGKTSQVYHCNECGQDEITIMPDVIEGFINEALQKNDVRSLKDYKKQYPGIEWEDTISVASQVEASMPEKHVIEEKRNNVSIDNSNTSKKEISISALENMIREYINEMNAPVEKEDLCAKYEEIGRAKVQTAILSLKSRGKIKEVAEDVYVIVRDYEEMQRLAEAEKHQQDKKAASIQQKAPDLIKRASLLDKKIVIDASNVVYYLDTSGTVHYLDSLLSKSRRGSKEWREKFEFIIENGQDVRAFIQEGRYTIFLMKDGSVRIYFSSYGKEVFPEWESYQKTIEGWDDIVSICQDYGSFVALKRDGSLVATGLNNNGQCNVDGFSGVKKIQMEYEYCFVLFDNGTMAVCGMRGEKKEDMHVAESWTDIVDFDTTGSNLIGLHSDGSVIACGRVEQREVKKWSSVVKVYAGAWNVAAITSDGRAYSTGEERKDINSWRNIVGLMVFPFYTVGLKADGTIVVSDSTDKMGDKICDWKNIVSFMSPGDLSFNEVILGFQEDGTILSSEPGAEDIIDNMKLFNSFDTIEEEEEKAEEEAISRLAEQASLRKELRKVTEQLEEKKKVCDCLETEYKDSLAALNRERSECAVPAEKEIKELNDRIWNLRNRISSLGFFKKKEKRELENTIAVEEEALRKAERDRDQQKEELKKALDEKMTVLKKNYEEQMKPLAEDISSLQVKLEELASKRTQKSSHIYEEWAAEDKEREREKLFIID